MPYENAHAALVSDGIVRRIIVIPYLDDDDEKITKYCNDLGLEGTWLDCSYLGNRRGRYPKIGDKYNSQTDEYEITIAQEETA